QPAVRLVTFTGSIAVGKRLAAMAGGHMKPAIMELGGHAPVIVCEDVDPIKTAATSVLVSVSKVLESEESLMIQGRWPDSREGATECGRSRTASAMTAAI